MSRQERLPIVTRRELDSFAFALQTVQDELFAVPGGKVEAGDSEQQQALALLQKEMLAFILEGVTERMERGEVPVLTDAVAAAIARQVEAAIDNRFLQFNLPTAMGIAEELARIARVEDQTSGPPPARSVFDAQSPEDAPVVRDDEQGARALSLVWRRLPAIWLTAPLLLLLGVAGWFAWQKSSALEDEAAARTRIAVERDTLSGELCKSAKAQQEQLALLRNTAIYRTNCPPQVGRLPDFCQAVDALGKASGSAADCNRP